MLESPGHRRQRGDKREDRRAGGLEAVGSRMQVAYFTINFTLCLLDHASVHSADSVLALHTNASRPLSYDVELVDVFDQRVAVKRISYLVEN